MDMEAYCLNILDLEAYCVKLLSDHLIGIWIWRLIACTYCLIVLLRPIVWTEPKNSLFYRAKNSLFELLRLLPD